MKKWKIEEITKFSLGELNSYIEEHSIQPSELIQYTTTFEPMKQAVRYTITYWVKVKE